MLSSEEAEASASLLFRRSPNTIEAAWPAEWVVTVQTTAVRCFDHMAA